jgi:transposase
MPVLQLQLALFSGGRSNDTWQKIHDVLHERVRVQVCRQPSPNVVIIDSQTVKTASKGGIAVMTLARR